MEDSKVSKAHWQVFVRVNLVLEYETVARTIHGLQTLRLNFIAVLVLEQI